MSVDQEYSDLRINLKTRKRLAYFDEESARSNAGRQKILIREATEKMNRYYEQFNLELDSVVLRERRIYGIDPPFDLKIRRTFEENPVIKKIKTVDAIKIKDTANISEKNFKMMSSYCKDFMPTLSAVLKETKAFNEVFTINENPFGYFTNIKEKIDFVSKYYLSNDKRFFENNIIKIKFCVDGFQATRKLRQILNVSFSIIHKLTNPHSSDGHFLIGLRLTLGNHFKNILLIKII